MIDPFNLENVNKTDSGLQEFLIFAIMVAGKTAKVMSKNCHNFLWESEYTRSTPFQTIENMYRQGVLESELKRARAGQYNKLYKAFEHIIHNPLDLQTCLIRDLEKIPGVGKKTSRFFIMYTRPNIECAVIDVHVKRWLREQGYEPPKSSEEYEYFETAFLGEAQLRGMNPKDLDTEIWRGRAK